MTDRNQSITVNVYTDGFTGHANVTFNGTRGGVTIGANLDQLQGQYQVEMEPDFQSRPAVSTTYQTTPAQFQEALAHANDKIGTSYVYGVEDICTSFVSAIYSMTRTADMPAQWGSLFSPEQVAAMGWAPVGLSIPGLAYPVPNMNVPSLNEAYSDYGGSLGGAPGGDISSYAAFAGAQSWSNGGSFMDGYAAVGGNPYSDDAYDSYEAMVESHLAQDPHARAHSSWGMDGRDAPGYQNAGGLGGAIGGLVGAVAGAIGGIASAVGAAIGGIASAIGSAFGGWSNSGTSNSSSGGGGGGESGKPILIDFDAEPRSGDRGGSRGGASAPRPRSREAGGRTGVSANTSPRARAGNRDHRLAA